MTSLLESEGDAVRNIGEELGKLTSTRSRARVLRLVLDSLDETEGIAGLPGGRTKALLVAGLSAEELEPIPPPEVTTPSFPASDPPRGLIGAGSDAVEQSSSRSSERSAMREQIADKLVADGYPYERAMVAAKKAIREVGKSDGIEPLLVYSRSILGARKQNTANERPPLDPDSPAVLQTVDFIARNPQTTIRAIATWAGLSISGAGARVRSGISGEYVDQPARGFYVVTDKGRKAIARFKSA